MFNSPEVAVSKFHLTQADQYAQKRVLLGRIATVARCGLLLQSYRRVAWSVCMSVCLSVGRTVGHDHELYKTDISIVMPFRLQTRAGPRNHVLDTDQYALQKRAVSTQRPYGQSQKMGYSRTVNLFVHLF